MHRDVFKKHEAREARGKVAYLPSSLFDLPTLLRQSLSDGNVMMMFSVIVVVLCRYMSSFSFDDQTGGHRFNRPPKSSPVVAKFVSNDTPSSRSSSFNEYSCS